MLHGTYEWCEAEDLQAIDTLVPMAMGIKLLASHYIRVCRCICLRLYACLRVTSALKETAASENISPYKCLHIFHNTLLHWQAVFCTIPRLGRYKPRSLRPSVA